MLRMKKIQIYRKYDEGVNIQTHMNTLDIEKEDSIVINVADGCFLGHRLFLCANSNMLKALLNSGMHETLSKTIELTQWTKEEFEPVFIFLHTGELHQSWLELNIEVVYKIADYLQIDPLLNVIKEFLSSSKVNDDIKGFIGLCEKFLASEEQILFDLGERLLMNCQIQKSLKLFSFSMVQCLVKSNYLGGQMYSEDALVNSVIDWIKLHPDADSGALTKNFRLCYVGKCHLIDNIAKVRQVPAIQLLKALEIIESGFNGEETDLPVRRARYNEDVVYKGFIFNISEEFEEKLDVACKDDTDGNKDTITKISPIFLAHQSKLLEDMINGDEIEKIEKSMFKDSSQWVIDTMFDYRYTREELIDPTEDIQEKDTIEMYYLAEKLECKGAIEDLKEEADEWGFEWLGCLANSTPQILFNEEILNSENWIHFSKEVVIRFLSFGEFNIDELVLFKRLVLWLKSHPNCPPNDVLQFVRLGLISQAELSSTVLGSKLVIGERLIPVLHELSVPSFARLLSKDFEPRETIPNRIFFNRCCMREIAIDSQKEGSIYMNGPDRRIGACCGYSITVCDGVTASLPLRVSYHDVGNWLLGDLKFCRVPFMLQRSCCINLKRGKGIVTMVIEVEGGTISRDQFSVPEDYPVVLALDIGPPNQGPMFKCFDIRQC
eukprot:TRINITY_DN774015_c0_g1_i1.p1 TRINITY_DN774015_c0_g1~~TRINITY_DN774015_c0_g1_i1.p1  ORF type:complete len:663 (-),score=90.54 TRINITY_DN774015_c0_g1_i1:115-2103(-)